MKRSAIFLLTFLLVISLTSGCSTSRQAAKTGESGKSKTKDSMVYNLGAEPQSLDPALCSEIPGDQVIYNNFEALVRHDENNVIEPAIAEKWETSDDGLVWTFKIRDSAKWYDGKPVTANDFVYSWKRTLNPEVGAHYSYNLYYIKNAEEYYDGKADWDSVGIKAVDDKTLEVTLKEPTSYILQIFSRHELVPIRQDIVEKDPDGWAMHPESYIGNGPFQVSKWVHNDMIEFVKNPNYWDAKNVKMNKLVFTEIVDENTSLASYESGEVDLIDNPPSQELARLKEEGKLTALPTIGTYYVSYNVNKKPLDDPRVREALTLAIDRKAIVENVTKGGEVPAGAFVPYGLPDKDASDDFRKICGDYYDPGKADAKKARQLLSDAGYPDGKGFPKLSYTFNTGEGHKQIGEALQQMWKKNLGIDIELKQEEWNVFLDTRKQGNYDIARDGYISDYVDPLGMLELLDTDNVNNNSHWSNKQYDSYIATARSKSDTNVRMDAMHKADALLMKECPVGPLYFYTENIVVRPGLKGYIASPLKFNFFRYASWK